MTYKEAREAAAQALTQTFDTGRGLTDPPALSEMREENRALAFSCIDAALSAFSAAGWELVPKNEPSEEMYDAFMRNANPMTPPSRDLMTWRGDMGNFIGDYQAMITAALKERQT